VKNQGDRMKEEAKKWIDANIWDGEDRSGCKGDGVKFDPDDLQELIDGLVEDLFIPKLKATERKLAEAEKYKGLYNPINEMMAPLGAHGMIYAKDDRVTAVMDALHDIDGGVFKPKSDYEASKGE
jgi:hypothetical protein